jgi:hypothetical protein
LGSGSRSADSDCGGLAIGVVPAARERRLVVTFFDRHGHDYGYVVGCDVCRVEAAATKRAQRARKRGLKPVPALPDEPAAAAVPDGPVVAAVRADLAELSHIGSRTLAAAAIVLARDLDNPGVATSHPALAKQLASLLDTLKREAAPRRGRLQVCRRCPTGDRPPSGAHAGHLAASLAACRV